jgi:aerobic carbon-monoxide dehydrogenase medium subunit
VVDVGAAITGSGGGFDAAALQDLVDGPIDPETDIHATADYRRNLAHVLTSRALDQARGNAAQARRQERAA